MDWIFLAIASPILFALGNIADKKVVGRLSPVNYAVLGGFLFLTNLVLLPLCAAPVSMLGILVFALVGILRIFAYYPFLKALQLEEASRVIPLTLSTPLFVLTMSVLFLGEQLKAIHFIAFFLILGGSFIVTARSVSEIFKPSKVLLLVTGSNLLFAVTDVLVKFGYGSLSLWTGLVWSAIGESIGAILLLALIRGFGSFRTEIGGLQKKDWTPILAALAFYFVGTITFYAAVSRGLVSITSVLGSTSALFVILIAIVASKFLPGFLKEDWSHTALIQKVFSTLLILAGVALLYRA